MKNSKYAVMCFIILACLIAGRAKANGLPDEDKDMVPDQDEISLYRTDPKNPDTDGDSYGDWLELTSGFSPHTAKKIKLEENDLDADGLNDSLELKFHTILDNPDTDADGFSDGEEIKTGSNPLDPTAGARLEKRIEIDSGWAQTLSYFLGGVRLGEFRVSTGKPLMPTPKGEFTISSKIEKAWSKTYGLWMPYWLGMGKFGIHELPVWPGGYREGEDHLGKPVSHGCIRLGIGPAKTLYNWTELGTKVNIH
ncbi:MAG: L,D-transpeptidase family protein [Patescibacteria group bacterium]|jgi:hypothetical protein